MTLTQAAFRTVLDEFAAAFETRKRDNGEEFTCLREDCPAWVTSDVMMRIHESLDDRLPNDWVYATACSFAETLTGYTFDDSDEAREHISEIAEGLVDAYNADRLCWLADNLGNAALCDEACEELGEPGDMFTRIAYGQCKAIERIGNAVIQELDDRLAQAEDDDE